MHVTLGLHHPPSHTHSPFTMRLEWEWEEELELVTMAWEVDSHDSSKGHRRHLAQPSYQTNQNSYWITAMVYNLFIASSCILFDYFCSLCLIFFEAVLQQYGNPILLISYPIVYVCLCSSLILRCFLAQLYAIPPTIFELSLFTDYGGTVPK